MEGLSSKDKFFKFHLFPHGILLDYYMSSCSRISDNNFLGSKNNLHSLPWHHFHGDDND